MTVAQYLVWFDDVVSPTEPMLRMVPDGKLDWKLTPTSFTLGQVVAHIPLALRFQATVLRGDVPPMKSMREILVSNRRQQSMSVEEAVSLFHTASREFKDAVGKLTDEEFTTGIVDTPQRGKMLCWRYAAFTLEHHIHHLMELHLSLKVLGVRVNTGTLYVR